ncbi:nucleotidyltransferase domain-containing protein [Echria macrotheca]|uniref:Nucleotidyltransferase domain-containing protein n=1 Tax=Echria macrotheca TaxID=438768 RepID=A0AAJ0FGL7_9PEZI|nr:nucleotidyltransferase domain-containing protein [Echria macrotheca]
MYPHHAESIQIIKNHFQADPSVQALVLTGSIAHGFETPTSDVDVLIILSDTDYQRHVSAGNLTAVLRDDGLCTYEGGYVDAKYASLSFVRLVAEKGSEPARWAFDGASVLFDRSGTSELQDLIRAAVVYPVADKRERLRRFRAQLEIWAWYCGEAIRKENKYLLHTAVGKLILFGGRLVLAHNEMLYPYHKWFLRVLQDAPEKPAGLMECIDELATEPTLERVGRFYTLVKEFQDWPTGPHRFGATFMEDSELNWLYLKTPVEDI